MSEPMSDERLAEIRAKWSNAEPGPWSWDEDTEQANDDFAACFALDSFDGGTPIPVLWATTISVRDEQMGMISVDKSAMQALADARTDVPDLLAEIERLRRRVETERAWR